MTLGVAWIRKAADGNELWLASDSRLTGDENIWDDCPKILLPARPDSVIAFSGATAQAYPLVLQMMNSIQTYRPATNGNLEFFHMLAHLERVANSMMGEIIPDAAVIGAPRTSRNFSTRGDSIVVGGYSRAHGGLAIRILRYHSDAGWKFSHVKPFQMFGGGHRIIAVYGDSVSRGRYRHLLKEELQARRRLEVDAPFDFEPLEVLARMLRMPPSAARRIPMSHRPSTIGGAPQVVRIRAGAQATVFAVSWERLGEQVVTLFGRRVASYENIDTPLLQVDEKGVSRQAATQWPTRRQS